MNADIIIAGGGPVGLAMACCLAGSGLRLQLVDAGKNPVETDTLASQAGSPGFDPRVSALTVASQALLTRLGAWDTISATRACPYHDMHVWDGEGTASIHFSAADLHMEALGHIVENRLLTSALGAVAQDQENLAILQGETLKDITVTEQDALPVSLVLDSGRELRARMLIGADGANSLVRAQAGFAVREWDYGHRAIVTTVKTARPHQYTAWQRFLSSGPLAFLPLHLPGVEAAGQQYCSIVWSCVTERAEGLLALDDAAFRQALGAAFEFRLGEILETDARVAFPLWQRHATDYVQDHFALVGDAAHTIHPLAGQGVNLGLADVGALSEVIAAALGRGEDYTARQVLSRYQRRRKGPNLGMMAAMEGFKRLFGTDDPALTWLRNTGFRLADQAPLLKHRLMRQAMGL